LNEKIRFRTLVVDDSAAVRRSLALLVATQQPLKVVGTAENGREAIDKVEELTPDLVLMDLQMPEINGLDATAKIRRHHPAVRVIVVTLHDNHHLRSACQRAGAHGFVSKTSGAQEILGEIQRVLAASVPGARG
jgi:DNA-binding NarL/FixJ family response regulator